MSKLHIVFAINIDLFDKSGQFIERVAFPLPDRDQYPTVVPNCTRRGLDVQEIGETVTVELQYYAFPWIRRVFAMFRVVACGFDHTECKYHIWLEHRKGEQIRSKQLAKAIYFADPAKGGKDTWMKREDRTLSGDEELNTLGLSKIELVPIVKEVLLVTEHTVHIDRLPEPELGK